MNPNEALDPDFLDEISKTNIEDYTCCICQLIPNPESAIEEENCGHIFCSQCLSYWQKKNNTCPFCKMEISKRSIKDKNKLVYRHLINLIVKCQEEYCKWKGIWKDYSSHVKNTHKKIKENVTNINAMFYGNYELYKYYKSTTHSHFLKFLDTTMDNGWCCDGRKLPVGCLSGITGFRQTKGLKRFRCTQCDYDLCEKCYYKYYDKNLSNNRVAYLFRNKYISEVHEHPLFFLDITMDNGWGCDGRKLPGGCLSGITGFNQTIGIKRFRCEQCDFDLCENCMNYYMI